MAMSEERAKHLELAGVVKSVHAHLRREYKRRKDDVNDLWKEHTEKTDILQNYASAMHNLATKHWEKNDGTRIDWCRDMCLEYFFGGLLKTHLEKEERRARRRTDGTGHYQGESAQERPGGGDTRATPGLENITDWSSVERDDLPDGCVSQREGCPDGSVNERDECPDGSANERPVPDGSVNYRDGQSQTAFSNISGLQTSRKCVELPFEGPIFLLDVGSCYNPFQHFEEFCVTAVDLHPATESVLQCDFLECGVSDRLLDIPGIAKDPASGIRDISGSSGIQGDSGNQRNGAVGCHSDSDTGCDFHPSMLKSPVTQLLRMSFDVVVFSLLLEYLPSCKQRFTCCQKAWDLLRLNGLFLVITPDSHRQHRNAAMIKSWKQCLEGIGFQRVCYLKQEHIHCMAFRRLESGSIEFCGQHDMLYIPQDFHEDEEEDERTLVQYDRDDIASDYTQLPNFIP